MVLQWRPGVARPAAAGYLKRRHPALVRLRDGRILAAGGETDRVQVFEPADGTWRDAGTLPQVFRWAHGVALADGRVLLAGADDAWRLLCAIGNADDGEWQACPGFEPFQDARGSGVTPHLGLLADERVLLTLSRQRAALWDADSGWLSVELREDNPRPLWPGNVRPEVRGELAVHRGARAFSFNDPRTGEWLDATLQSLPAFNGAALALPDGRTLAVHVSDTGFTSLALWDAQAGEWSAPRDDRNNAKLGTALVPTADGCVLAWAPGGYSLPLYGEKRTGKPAFVIIDPRTLSVRHIHGLFVDVRDGRLVALNDGTVMVAGTDIAGVHSGPGFRRFRASCRGVEAVAGEASPLPRGEGAPPRRPKPNSNGTGAEAVVPGEGAPEPAMPGYVIVLLGVVLPILIPVAVFFLRRRMLR
jgi:hypothetical protein